MSSKDEAKQDRRARLAELARQEAYEQQGQEKGRRDRTVSVQIAREASFLEDLGSVLQTVFKKGLSPVKYVRADHKAVQERILNLCLSDLHLHSLLDPRELPLQYGPVEEARRLAAVCVQTVEYKRQYRDETTLYVHLLGDIIAGKIKDLQSGAPLAEQVAAAISLITQALRFLSSQFPRVVVFCTPGNHGRNPQRHPKRAIHEKWDGIETILYYAVKQACQSVANIEVHIPYSPYYTFSLFSAKGMGTHGDTLLVTGTPSKTIDVESISRKINQINAAIKERYSVVVIGHNHIGLRVDLNSKVKLIGNGCLTPPDGFALTLGAWDCACGQYIWESTRLHAVGDSRFVEVDESTDKDKSLDKIITPFSGF
jgi:hypothetical protein